MDIQVTLMEYIHAWFIALNVSMELLYFVMDLKSTTKMHFL